MQPLVSIIVPVYNAAPDLARCIESVRSQTYTNFELLLINDGSHDASLPICKMYENRDKRIKVIDKPNSGVSATRNIAISLACGVYMQFVDADDYLEPYATQTLVQKAEQASADLVISHYYRVNGEEITSYGVLSRSDVMSRREYAKELMEAPASFYFGVLWNKLYRTRIIRQHEIFCSEELSWSEDFLFNLEYIRYATRFCAVAKPLYYYVKNDTGICATKINWKNVMYTKRNLFSYYKDLYKKIGIYDKYKLKIHSYLVAMAEHG